MFKAIEYGVSHGGHGGSFKPGDCHLQSGSKSKNCNGKYWNLDLYVMTHDCGEWKMSQENSVSK